MNRVKLNTIHLNEIALDKRSLNSVGVLAGDKHAHGEYFDMLDKNGFYLQDTEGYELLAQ